MAWKSPSKVWKKSNKPRQSLNEVSGTSREQLRSKYRISLEPGTSARLVRNRIPNVWTFLDFLGIDSGLFCKHLHTFTYFYSTYPDFVKTFPTFSRLSKFRQTLSILFLTCLNLFPPFLDFCQPSPDFFLTSSSCLLFTIGGSLLASSHDVCLL